MIAGFSKFIKALVVIVLLAAGIPTASGQPRQPTSVELAPYEGNPVLTAGAAGEWDSGFVSAGLPIFKDDLYYLFYSGGEDLANKPHAVGYATSEDGLHWTKYANNPILTMDPAVASGGIPYAIPVVDGDKWALFFNDDQYVSILRATAPGPSGPWTIDPQPVLKPGGSLEWDSRNLGLNTVLHNGDQYVLYYHSVAPTVGMATSPDGITWTKYNDPTTTEQAFANSDPVFTVGEKGAWDSVDVVPTVLHGDRGWTMYYMGADTNQVWALGYATSLDGITWTRFGDEPVMLVPEGSSFWLEGVLPVDGQDYIFYDMMPQAGFLYGQSSSALGVTIAAVTWE